MSQFLLISGTFYGAWFWDKTIGALEKYGHQGRAIDLSGQGQDQTPLKNVTLAAMVNTVVAALTELPGPVVLIGHSMAGMVISAAGDKAPELIKMLVYVCTFLPRDGESLLSIERRNPKMIVPKSMTFDADQTVGTLMSEKARELFYHECTDADVASACARPRPQALSAFENPIHLTADRFGRISRVYVECTEDHALAIEMQRDMIAKSPPADVRSLPSSHSPFLSMPNELAAVLFRTCESVGLRRRCGGNVPAYRVSLDICTDCC
ncbi:MULTISPECIES: alpha/beta fold hydrolase [Bradyrhizobium]|uniref:alpha/beta fold hydrolase n=1 Tax=Bradyrhizobium elkanii TaxID=29448 RepID=UPI000428F702|nr:alpha/beta fold hydrolase [Bradyrhizobium elkanii]